MRVWIVLLFITTAVYCKAQNVNETEGLKYFAQIKVDTLSDVSITELRNELESNPYIYLSRYDKITNGLLIITEPLAEFNTTVIESWLPTFETQFQCVRIGVQGVDRHYFFSSDFCSKINQ